MVNEFEVKAGAVPFLSDFTPFRYSGALPVTVDGAIVSSADVTQKEGREWEIYMDGFVLFCSIYTFVVFCSRNYHAVSFLIMLKLMPRHKSST